LALIATYAIASLAQNLLAGYADVPSLGNVAFMAVSAYTAGSLISLGGMPAAPAVLLAVLAAGALGLVVGVPALRISGMHLAIVTVVLVFAGQEIMNQWDVNHSPSGIGVSTPGWLLDERGLYATSVLVGVLIYLLVRNMLRSRSGRAIIALSENQFAALAVGIDAMRYRLAAFVLSGMITGVAGILFLYYTPHVTPSAFSLDLSLAFLSMMIVGGSRSLGGSLLGAIIVGLLPQALGLIPGSVGQLRAKDLGPAVYSLLILLTLRLFPEGIWNAAVRTLEERRGDK
jgi:branched-chain amino acid transport system permease protein